MLSASIILGGRAYVSWRIWREEGRGIVTCQPTVDFLRPMCSQLFTGLTLLLPGAGWGKIWFKHHLYKGRIIITSGLNLFIPIGGPTLFVGSLWQKPILPHKQGCPLDSLCKAAQIPRLLPCEGICGRGLLPLVVNVPQFLGLLEVIPNWETCTSTCPG